MYHRKKILFNEYNSHIYIFHHTYVEEKLQISDIFQIIEGEGMENKDKLENEPFDCFNF